jgi:hypothetical protein
VMVMVAVVVAPMEVEVTIMTEEETVVQFF